MLGGDGWLSQLIPDRLILTAFLWLNYLVAAIFAISEVMRSRTSQGSIAWLLSLVLLPFPTTILYAIFGLKFFDEYAALQTHSGRELRRAGAGKVSILDLPTSAEWPVLSNVSQLPFLAGNDAELLIDGAATFKSIFDGISRAQSSVLVQFYIIRDDELGREFASRLIERAQAGVAVHLLYDDVGCFWLPRAYKRRLREAGVKVAGFNQRHRILRLLGPTRINYRNHRKMLLIDGKEAWTGGLNVGNEYMGLSPIFGRWRDTHVRVAGPAALAAALTFREDWQWATGEVLTPDVPSPIPVAGPQPVLVMPTGPADMLEDCAIAFNEVIARAERRLWIVSPYFVPDVDMQTSLYAAAMRGVDVRVLVPQKPDHRLVWLASIAHANRMVNHGVKIYRYTQGFLHQKVILVDDRIAGVGTVNFDNRSFRINFEITLWFTHEKMIGEVGDMLEEDFAASHLLTTQERASQPVAMRFLSEAARLLSPVL
ncbi:MAG: cardiolipin synthase [Devosia sp.]|nr:cardiolipin synthase [Devosia sp.]